MVKVPPFKHTPPPSSLVELAEIVPPVIVKDPPVTTRTPPPPRPREEELPEIVPPLMVNKPLLTYTPPPSPAELPEIVPPVMVKVPPSTYTPLLLLPVTVAPSSMRNAPPAPIATCPRNVTFLATTVCPAPIRNRLPLADGERVPPPCMVTVKPITEPKRFSLLGSAGTETVPLMLMMYVWLLPPFLILFITVFQVATLFTFKASMPPGTATVALAFLLVSVFDVTVTVRGVMISSAPTVKTPSSLILVLLLILLATVQLTDGSGLFVPVIVAVNCWVLPLSTLTAFGLIATPVTVGVALLLVPLLPLPVVLPVVDCVTLTEPALLIRATIVFPAAMFLLYCPCTCAVCTSRPRIVIR